MKTKNRIDTETKRVLIYVRVSKKRSDQTSLASQEKEARAFAESKGWEVVIVFTENGKSAYRPGTRRPEFDRAMAMCEAHGVDIFLVWKLDRFYRSGSEFNTQWSKLQSFDVEFWSVQESWLDTSTASGRSMMSALAYQAEIESENRSQRTTAWHNQRNLVNGEGVCEAIPGGHRPYGYKRVNGAFVQVPEEAQVLTEAAKRICKGETFRSVHRSLSPKSSLGSRNGVMSDRGLRKALTNPTTYGLKRTTNGSLVKGAWTPILPPSQFGQVTGYFDNPNRRTNNGANTVAHLLSGMLVCSVCEANGETKPRHGKLRSRGNRNKLQCQCGLTINEANTEAFIVGRVFEKVTVEIWQGWKVKGHGHDTIVRDQIQAAIDHIDMKLIQGEYANDMERYDRLNNALREKLRLAMSDEPLDLPEAANVEEGWEVWTLDDKRKVLSQAIKKVTVVPTRGSGAGYNVANRIKIEWK